MKAILKARFAIPLAACLILCFLGGCGAGSPADSSTDSSTDALVIPLPPPTLPPALAPGPQPAAPVDTAAPVESPADQTVDQAVGQAAGQAADQHGAASPTPEGTPAATASPTPQAEITTIAEGFYYKKLDDALQKRITGMSYPAEGKVDISYDDLRYVGIRYVDFEGKRHDGELMVHRKLAKEVAEIFLALYEAGYPLASVRLVDDYGEPGDDNLSMAANNTSAFNYRRVTGSKTLSRHSYGAAIDINPVYNPYIDGDRVAPPNAADYVDRSRDFPGKIDHDDLCYKLFTKAGWSWGGDFKGDKDYQHFSRDIS